MFVALCELLCEDDLSCSQVDLNKAKELGIKVARVPAYSPEAVAEVRTRVYF